MLVDSRRVRHRPRAAVRVLHARGDQTDGVSRAPGAVQRLPLRSLCALAFVFAWVSADNPGAWVTFTVVYLAILAVLTLASTSS